MGQWKKPLVIGVFVAAGLALALGWFALKRYRQESSAQPPKPWNPNAIKSSFAGVQVREMDAANAVLVFYYDLENTTDFDYRLESGPNLVLMSRLKSNGSLSSEKLIKLSYAAFVPARSRARVALEIARSFAWPTRTDAASQGKFRELVNGEVANLKGFVLFDGATRYQIELPGAWQEARQIPAGAAPN